MRELATICPSACPASALQPNRRPSDTERKENETASRARNPRLTVVNTDSLLAPSDDDRIPSIAAIIISITRSDNIPSSTTDRREQ